MSKEKIKVYISGKISGLTEKEYTQNFWEAYKIIATDFGFKFDDIIHPLQINPFLGVKCWFCYMLSDLIALRKCTHIAMQNNWIDSKGSVIEYFFAKFIFRLQIIWL